MITKPPNPAHESSYRQLAIRISQQASESEKEALKHWIDGLLRIKTLPKSTSARVRDALAITIQSKVIWPIATLIAGEVKRLAWNEIGTKGRFGIGAAVGGIALFGGQSAGIAALGSAVGVPLWVVLGAGGAFWGVLYEELAGSRNRSDTHMVNGECRVIELEEEPKSSASKTAYHHVWLQENWVAKHRAHGLFVFSRACQSQVSDGYVKLFFVFDDVWRTLLAKEARDIEVTPLTKSEIMSAARAINVMKRGAEWMSWEEMEDKAEYGAYLREIDKIE